MTIMKKETKTGLSLKDRNALISRWLSETFKPGMLIRFHSINTEGMSAPLVRDFYGGLVGKTARIADVGRTHLAFKIEEGTNPMENDDKHFYVYPDMDKFEIVKEDEA